MTDNGRLAVGSPSDRDYLKAMIDEGLASGILDQDAEEVLEEIIAELPAKND